MRLLSKLDNKLYFELNPWIRKHVINPILRKRLRNKDFTLLCNNCNGACILHDLNMPFNSPFVNLWMKPNDFLKYCNNIEYYQDCQLLYHSDESKKYDYPVAKLGDLVIYFQHYRNFEEAERKWLERTKRINKNNLYVLWIAKDGYTHKDIELFKQLNYNKVALFKEYHNDVPNSYYIPGFEKDKQLGLLMDFIPHQYWGKKYYDTFDYVSWFNKNI